MPTCRYWVPEHKVNPEGQQVKILWLVHTSFKLVDNVPQVCMSRKQTHWKRSRTIMTKSRCSRELYIGCPQIAHPLFTTAQTSGATLRHLNLTLGSYISSSLPGSLDALIFIFSLRNQYVHFLGGKPGGYSEQHPQIPPWPVRKCSLWNPLGLILCPVHCVDWKLPNSNDARLTFPKVDTDALPHVVHLISVKWESVREHNRQQNTKLLSYRQLWLQP